MKLMRVFPIAVLTILLLLPPALAQRPDRKAAGEKGRNQLAQTMQSRFDRSSPAIDTELPDISGFRADGTAIALKSLRGKYTVLVFGCLT